MVLQMCFFWGHEWLAVAACLVHHLEEMGPQGGGGGFPWSDLLTVNSSWHSALRPAFYWEGSKREGGDERRVGGGGGKGSKPPHAGPFGKHWRLGETAWIL